MLAPAEKAHVSFNTEPEIRDELARRAALADRSLSAEIRQAIRAYLERSDTEEEEEA